MAARTRASGRKRKTSSRRTRLRTPRVLVLRAPGTNCDRETAYAFEAAGGEAVAHHVNALIRKPRLLRDMQGLAIPGGFSYGDDLGAGTVLGTTLRTHLIDEIRRLVDRGGIVLGICNGFQVLARTGLLPGFAPQGIQRDLPGIAEEGIGPARAATLAFNLQGRYEDRWVNLRAESDRCIFFRKGDRLACPVAHAEGRFLPMNEATLTRLAKQDQVALRYVGPGELAPAGYPHNPNGAVEDIAGVCDETGRILGMMPHPERNQFPWQDPRFHRGTAPRTPEGLTPFKNAVAYLQRQFS